MKSSHIQAWPYNSGQDFNMWKWTAGWVTIYISKEVQKKSRCIWGKVTNVKYVAKEWRTLNNISKE